MPIVTTKPSKKKAPVVAARSATLGSGSHQTTKSNLGLPGSAKREASSARAQGSSGKAQKRVNPEQIVARRSSQTRSQRAMFQCGECDYSEFDLMVRTDQSTPVSVSTNQHDEIVIRVGQRPPFVADIAFMNRFASCRHCGTTGMWRYWFPSRDSVRSSASHSANITE